MTIKIKNCTYEPTNDGIKIIHEEIPDIFGFIDELISKIPENEWGNVPTDLAENVDEYLYGNKK